MDSSSHLIVQQRLRLRLPAATVETAGMELQRQTEHALLSPGLLAALDAVLTQALVTAGLPSDSYLHIDQLHLDLGTLSEDTLGPHLTARLPALLLPLVVAAAREATTQAATAPGQPVAVARAARAAGQVTDWPLNTSVGAKTGAGGTTRLPAASPPLLTVGASPEATEWTASLRSADEVTFRAWCFFLQHGVLPASYTLPTPHRAWEQELLRLLAAPTPSWIAELRKELRHSIRCLRLVRQFSPLVVARVCQVLAPTGAPARSRLRQWLSALLAPDHLVPAAGEGVEAVASGEAVATALLTEAATATLSWAAFEQALAPPVQPADQAAAIANLLPTAAAADVALNAALPRATARPPDIHYVANAGVVLLHPFLPACFAACGWLNTQEEFVSQAARTAAVLLVHFLATGRRQASEHELLLPRLLCGMPLTDPAPPRRLSLSQPARAEARQLLQAAIRHWQALRRTSPAGLRTAFLQRAGKLELLALGGPTLTVEQRAQDVLLSRLPYGWSVGLVQLPWLQSRLQVNWA